jgi:hypothetical protein
LPWPDAARAVQQDFRYLAMSAYRRALPLVNAVLVERLASAYANQEGWIYPDCDNKPTPEVYERDLAAAVAQRRQLFRHKARQILTAIWAYLEHDTDTEAQRQQAMNRVEGQLKADQMVVSMFRGRRGVNASANHG